MTLAEGCMSSGWVYGVVAVHNWQLGLFDARAQEDVWAKDSSVLIASSYMPKGQVERVDGGFRFSGRWNFSSGVDKAEWLFLGGIVSTKNGVHDYPTFLVPRSDISINDNWHTVGLKGTGSKEVVIEGAFVPEYRTHRAIDGFVGLDRRIARCAHCFSRLWIEAREHQRHGPHGRRSCGRARGG